MKISHQDLLKIAQSGHTAGTVHHATFESTIETSFFA